MQAYTPALSKSMGVFIPLIVVNCIIMGRVESFAYKRTVPEAFFDALGMGIGYMWVLCGISLIREVLGSGSILGHEFIPEEYRIGFFTGAPGGFFVFAMFIAVTLTVRRIKDARVQDSGPECCTTEGGDK
jgi:electron transport complex protein RnfE